VEGVHFSGFVQPTELPGSFSQAGCFVLPSIWEPWGVVIHEACSAGVPVICTSSCGASVHLVQDGFNGLIVEPGSAASLARAFKQFASLSVEQRAAMGETSYQLSLQFTPQRWASTVCQRGKEMMEEKLAQRD
jgi:glycosyltransferase involved in cell wall biosynthesis